MERYICIHGHFYQPPRENPWLESVECQDSAHPFHDWNERLAFECYGPNALSRILDDEAQITDIVNNYEKISFDFGPTLMHWLKLKMPDTYERVIQADINSRKHFGGHGSAIAQCYSHMIMPLANARDKRTQVLWGIADFKYHYNRDPEGMWIPEMAVDYETLEIMAEQGILFTLLSRKQCARVRKIGEEIWNETHNGAVDPKRPYLLNLPSGRRISIFFYDHEISQEMAFGNLLQNGGSFAQRLQSLFSDEMHEPQLANAAVNGEIFGHYQYKGDMALAYALNQIEKNNETKITVYGEYLEKYQPRYEVDVHDSSSWSCTHGVERWRNDCGCNSKEHPQWHQHWRRPLRDALDWLRDSLIPLCEEKGNKLFKDFWAARDLYICVILYRNENQAYEFLKGHASRELDQEESILALALLEIQRNAMLMFTSCGWFFDEISGLETQQVLRYASRAMHLAKNTFHIDFENAFMNLLINAQSNLSRYQNGKEAYRQLILGSSVDNPRFAGCYALSLLYKESQKQFLDYAYQIKIVEKKEEEWGRFSYVHGLVEICSSLTFEKNLFRFLAADLGEQNIIAAIMEYTHKGLLDEEHEQIHELMIGGDSAKVIETLKAQFHYNYTLWDVLRDVQRAILQPLISDRMRGPEAMYRQIYESSHSTLQLIRRMNAPPPSILTMTMEYVLNQELLALFQKKTIDAQKWELIIGELENWNLKTDTGMLAFQAALRLQNHFKCLVENPEERTLLRIIKSELTLYFEIPLPLNLYNIQNDYFQLAHTVYPKQKKKRGIDRYAWEWIRHFESIQPYLGIKLP